MEKQTLFENYLLVANFEFNIFIYNQRLIMLTILCMHVNQFNGIATYLNGTIKEVNVSTTLDCPT